MEFNNFNSFSPYTPYDGNTMDANMNEQNLFNPAIQYEQAYMYYRYLAKQMDYKIKCKEYENLVRKDK